MVTIDWFPLTVRMLWEKHSPTNVWVPRSKWEYTLSHFCYLPTLSIEKKFRPVNLASPKTLRLGCMVGVAPIEATPTAGRWTVLNQKLVYSLINMQSSSAVSKIWWLCSQHHICSHKIRVTLTISGYASEMATIGRCLLKEVSLYVETV